MLVWFTDNGGQPPKQVRVANVMYMYIYTSCWFYETSTRSGVCQSRSVLQWRRESNALAMNRSSDPPVVSPVV